MTLRLYEGFDWLPVTDDSSLIGFLLAASQYYQSGSWFSTTGVAQWSIDSDTAFDSGNSLWVNGTITGGSTHNRILSPVPAASEGWAGFRCKVSSGHTGYFSLSFMDAATGITHLSLRCTEFGIVEVFRDMPSGDFTPIASTSSGCFYPDTWFYLEARVKISNTAGEVEVRINTKTVLSVVSTDTQNGTATTFDLVGFQGAYSQTFHSWVEAIRVDDLYYCDTAGSVNKGFLGNVRVKTQEMIGAGSHTGLAVGGTQTMVTLGRASDMSSSTVPTANAPYSSYNAFLRRVYVPVSTSLSSIRFTTSSTSTTAGNKALLFADSAGEPGALLASGVANVGYTAGVEEVLTFSSAPSLTGGNYYWIGFAKSSTGSILSAYLSGALGTPGRMASLSTYTTPATIGAAVPCPEINLYGVTTTAMDNWQAVQNRTLGEDSHVYSATSGDYDLYDVDPTISAPYVHGIQVKTAMRQDDATQRTSKNLLKIGSTGTLQEGAANYLNQSFSIYKDIFELNPDTGVFFTGTEANDAQVGPKVSS